MKPFKILVRILATILSICLTVSIIGGTVKAFEGNYFHNAPILATGILICVVVISVFVIGWVLKRVYSDDFMLFILVCAMPVVLQSCNYAKSNQQVLISSDCGMSWKQINAGDAVPKGTMSPCYMKVVIPNFPMQGDAKFITNLAARVRVETHIDYDYSITNGLAFIKEAKTLGKANADADSNEALDPSQFEGAENRVIDKRIKDVSKQLFLTQDIIELDQAELEEELLRLCNKRLEPLGVTLNFITLTFDTDEQTRQAIDVATAMKIYQTKGLSDLGKVVITARAGATKVTVENKIEPTLADKE